MSAVVVGSAGSNTASRRRSEWIPDRAAYNYAEYLPERRNMMKFWSDYLDNLRAGKMDMPLHDVRNVGNA